MTNWTDGYVADVAYTHGFYRELTPAFLNFVGLINGVRTPDLNAPLAWCELGCGQGFSANILAAANPGIAFHAADFNPAHIAGARRMAAEGGNPNAHFYEQSFAELAERNDLPQFDYITLHGVYSWILPEHRKTIVQFVRERLKPGGLLYVSYNALPGWASGMPLRNLMRQVGRGGGTIGRVESALDFMGRLDATGAGYFANNPGAKTRLERLRGQNKNYLAHEYMNAGWTPFYHSEVADEFAAAKVGYLGTATILESLDVVNLSPEQQKLLAEIEDPAVRETIRDYITDQVFRRDVYVKGRVPHTAATSRAAWMATTFCLTAARQSVELKIKGALGEAQLQPDVYTPILDALALGPKLLSTLVADKSIGGMEWAKLTQALTVLVGAGHVQPVEDGGRANPEAAKRAKAFNLAVSARAAVDGELLFLAAPAFRGGLNVDRLAQLFVAALARGEDPVQSAWKAFASQNQRLMKDGKALATPEENLAELKARYAEFQEKTAPGLKAAGIL